MNITPPPPPRLPRFLASLFLPAGPARDGVLGDMYELYTARRASAGRVRADLWYWYESGLAVVRYTVERLKRWTTFHGRPHPRQRDPKRRAGSLEAMQQDIRFAIRMLRKTPGFTVVAALTIALGIGATTTIFSVVNAVLLRPPAGIRSPGEMVRLHRIDEEGKSFNDVSYANYRAYRDGSIGVADLTGSALVSISMRTTGMPELQIGFLAAHNFFRVLGVRPALGRFFLPEEDENPGTHLVAVLSHSTWLRRFDGDSAVIGQTINLNKRTFTVVGVTEEGFRGPASILDIAVYLAMSAAPIINDSYDLESREATWVSMVGRRSPGVPREQVSAAVNRISANLKAAFPDGNPDYGIDVQQYTPIGKQAFLVAAAVSLFLFVISGTVLLIASINVGSMLLSRATQRRREVALRLALGAGRARVVRQLLAESILLFTLGGGGGLLLTLYATKALSTFQLPFDVPFLILDFSPDMRVLAFSLLVGLVTGIVFGLAPALQVTKPDLATILKLGSGGGSATRSRLRGAFVVVQVAGSALLLVTAGLFARGLARANAIDIGFDPENVHFLSSELDFYDYSDDDAARFYRDLVERTAALPEVESVGLTDNPPIVLAGLGGQTIQFTVPGREASRGQDSLVTNVSTVTAGFFDTFRMPMVRGRSFADTDRDGARMVAVINETLAQRMWPDASPLGQGQQIQLESADRRQLTVVGVVRNAKYRTLNEDPRSMLYLPYQQWPNPDMVVVARVGREGPAITTALNNIMSTLDSDLPVDANAPYEDMMGIALLPNRLGALLTGVFGALGLLLASLGLYGVLAYTVSQRTREIGIRIALGAANDKVRGLVLRDGLRLTAIGLAIGFAAALAGSRVLRGLLYGVSPTDPITFGGIAALLIGVALAASYLPARRAMRTDPVEALRAE